MKKKNYTTPEMEVAMINTAYMICDNPASSNAGKDPSTPPEAPRRRVF